MKKKYIPRVVDTLVDERLRYLEAALNRTVLFRRMGECFIYSASNDDVRIFVGPTMTVADVASAGRTGE